MRATIWLVLCGAVAGLGGCYSYPRESHYDVQFRNASDRAITVELLGTEQGGTNRIRADLAPGGEYFGRLYGYGPGYVEARARLRDDPEKDRYYICELPAGNLRREVRIEEGRIVFGRYATRENP